MPPRAKSTNAEWYDPGTKRWLSFNQSGMFVDSSGRGPQKGFRNDDSFGDWLHAHVEQAMRDRGLHSMRVPNEPGGAPVFFTPGAFLSPARLLILISGSGRIHAGVWSVGVCAYHGLHAGSVLPCLDEAARLGMEVLVLNPNHPGARLLPGRGSAAIRHTLEVFETVVIQSFRPKRVFIICHSFGGQCASTVFNSFPEWTMQTVAAVAMTDGFPGDVRSRRLRQWVLGHCINWVHSDRDVNARLPDANTTRVRSAATRDHPLTTHKAFPFIWRFFTEMLQPPPTAAAQQSSSSDLDSDAGPSSEIDEEPEWAGEANTTQSWRPKSK
jgi:hypothetical protein